MNVCVYLYSSGQGSRIGVLRVVWVLMERALIRTDK